MKKNLFILLFVLFATAFTNNLQAQYYCFFVDNQSGQTFNELKIRPSGTSAFSADLLPSDFIESGNHFFVKTANDAYTNYDVQITKMDGTPLLFTWKGTDGKWYENKSFITLNVKDLHTLVIGSDDNGNLNFGVYNYDKFKYGHPCE